MCGKAGVQAYFKGNNTIKDLLVAPKNNDDITNKGGVIYRYKCDHLGCTMEYISDIGRTLRDRYKEHPRTPPPFMTIPTPQVIPSNLTATPQWVGSPKASPRP